MTKVAVLTDSTAGLPETILNNLNIKTVAYYIHRGQEVLRDLVTIQREEFVQWMIGPPDLPLLPPAPSPADYLNAYEELAGAGAEEIISIHMSSKISGGYQAAVDRPVHAQREQSRSASGGDRYAVTPPCARVGW